MYVLHRFLITDEHLQSQYALTFMSVHRQMAMIRVACCASRPSYTFNSSAETCGKWMIRHTLGTHSFLGIYVQYVCVCVCICICTVCMYSMYVYVYMYVYIWMPLWTVATPPSSPFAQ